jgi:hypothetical protein
MLPSGSAALDSNKSAATASPAELQLEEAAGLAAAKEAFKYTYSSSSRPAT